MSGTSGFERGIAVVAGLITIGQVIFAFLASSPRVEMPITAFSAEMMLGSRVVITGIIGCVAALSYGVLMRQVVSFSIPVGLFVSAILSLIGAWFALLIGKVVIEPGMQATSVGEPVMYTLFGGALLFCGGMGAVGIPITVNEGGENKPTTFCFSTVVPFVLLIAISMYGK